MAPVELTEQDWQIRLFVYTFFVDQERPPLYQEVARQFAISDEAARDAYHRLNERHAIFLDPGTDVILMAHPLSAIPTGYRVTIQDKQLWANCAWDSLGIPAMLGQDAQIEATHPQSGERITYAVQNAQLIGADVGVVHFLKPFRHWYDDLVDT